MKLFTMTSLDLNVKYLLSHKELVVLPLSSRKLSLESIVMSFWGVRHAIKL